MTDTYSRYDHDQRRLRVGSHYNIHLYLVDPSKESTEDDDEPAGTVMAPWIAKGIVEAWNAYRCDPPVPKDNVGLLEQRGREAGYQAGRIEAHNIIADLETRLRTQQREAHEAVAALVREREGQDDRDKVWQQRLDTTLSSLRCIEVEKIDAVARLAQAMRKNEVLEAERAEHVAELQQLREFKSEGGYSNELEVAGYTVGELKAKYEYMKSRPMLGTVFGRRMMVTALGLNERLEASMARVATMENVAERQDAHICELQTTRAALIDQLNAQEPRLDTDSLAEAEIKRLSKKLEEANAELVQAYRLGWANKTREIVRRWCPTTPYDSPAKTTDDSEEEE